MSTIVGGAIASSEGRDRPRLGKSQNSDLSKDISKRRGERDMWFVWKLLFQANWPSTARLWQNSQYPSVRQTDRTLNSKLFTWKNLYSLEFFAFLNFSQGRYLFPFVFLFLVYRIYEVTWEFGLFPFVTPMGPYMKPSLVVAFEWCIDWVWMSRPSQAH